MIDSEPSFYNITQSRRESYLSQDKNPEIFNMVLIIDKGFIAGWNSDQI